jgi:hypothetical protein
MIGENASRTADEILNFFASPTPLCIARRRFVGRTIRLGKVARA